MRFIWPLFLYFMLLLPALIAVLYIAAKRREKTAAAFADSHLLPDVLKKPSKTQMRLPLILQLIALGSLLFASSRPVATVPLLSNQAAVVIALDASKSMLADDVDPTRLDAAKHLAKRFIEMSPRSTQIGLVSFSDVASILVAPTTEREELLQGLERVKPAQNTSLASAVVTGVRLLPGREQVPSPSELEPEGFTPLAAPEEPAETPKSFPPGSILIFSDGVTNVNSNPELEAQDTLEIASSFAKDNNVKLYTLAFGREGGSVARIDGQTYFVPFEPENLEELANDTEGLVIDPDDEDEIQSVFKELGQLIRWHLTSMEISSLLSALAILLLLVAAALNLRWQRRVP
jgi:Ca-activated chloride channel family protein